MTYPFTCPRSPTHDGAVASFRSGGRDGACLRHNFFDCSIWLACPGCIVEQCARQLVQWLVAEAQRCANVRVSVVDSRLIVRGAVLG